MGLWETNHYLDYGKPGRLGDIHTLHLLDAIGTREIKGWKEGRRFQNILEADTGFIEEFKRLDNVHQKYFMERFKDKKKYYFLHESRSGKLSLYDIFDKNYRGSEEEEEDGPTLLQSLFGEYIR